MNIAITPAMRTIPVFGAITMCTRLGFDIVVICLGETVVCCSVGTSWYEQPGRGAFGDAQNRVFHHIWRSSVNGSCIVPLSQLARCAVLHCIASFQ
jgi:hypothetical protein